MLDALSSFANSHPLISYLIAVFICSVISYPLKMLVGRLAFAIALRSERIVDDLIVDALKPFRFCIRFAGGGRLLSCAYGPALHRHGKSRLRPVIHRNLY